MNFKTSNILFLMVSSLLPSLGVIIYFFVTPTNSIWSPIVYYTLKTLQFTLPLFYFRMILRSPRELSLFYKKPSRLNSKTWVLSLALMLFCFLFTVVAYFLFLKDLPFIDTVRLQILDNLTRLQVKSLKSFIILAVGLSVVHSFLEEYYWRGFVDPLLKKIFPRWERFSIYLVGALLFTLHHLVLIYKFLGDFATFWNVLFFGFFIFVPGFVWSYQMDHSKRVYPSWIGHIGADIGLMVIAALIVGF